MRNLLFLLIVSGIPAFGQLHSLTGKVMDGEDRSVLPGATILLVNVKDSTRIHTCATNDQGGFLLENLSQAFYKLTITSLGYQPEARYVRINGITDLGEIPLKRDTKLLDEVRIRGEVVPVEVQGDTTRMNADAYKTNPDASAEDLIAKMPGIIVSGGTVQAQGENVQRVLVDGKEFFSNDPSAALKNIPAEIIDKIEVFDQQSEQSQFSGFDDGNTTKTINIITRQEMRDGEFGRAYAGAGTDERYSLGGNFNIFDEHRRVSVLGMINNINQQNFSNEDLLGVAGARASRGRRGGGGVPSGNSNNFQTGQEPGIAASKAVGINLDEQIGEKLKLNGSYFFNQVENNVNQLSHRDTFIGADSSQIYQEESVASSLNRNHRVNLRLEYDLDENNSLLFTPSFRFQQNDTYDYQNGLSFTPVSDTVSSTVSTISTVRDGFNAGGNLLYRHRFSTRGRTLSLNMSAMASDQQGESLQESASRFFLSDKSDSINQWTDIGNPGYQWGANVIYTEPLGERAQLQLSYSLSRQYMLSERETYLYDPLNEVRMGLDTALSNKFQSTYETHRPTAGIMWRQDKLMMRAGLSYQWASLEGDQEFPQQGTIRRTFSNFLPSLMLRFRFSQTSNLRVFYRTTTDAPSVTQLQNVVDNSDPLFLTTGNPELGQTFSHFLVSRYSTTNPEKSTSFFLLAMLRNQNDYVTNNTFLVRQDTTLANGIEVNRGTQVSQPVNQDGFWNARTLATYGFPMGILRSNLNTNLGITYTRIPGFINGEENVSNTYNYSGGFVLGSNISEKVDFTLSYNADFNVVRNSLQPELEDDYLSQTVGARLNLIFGKGIVLRSDVSFIQYSGYANELLNDNFTLWNASIGKKFLKDQRGEISVSVFDMLKQNVSISRVNTDSYFQETRTNVLQQYFMVSFVYTVRNFSAVAAPQDDRGTERRLFD